MKKKKQRKDPERERRIRLLIEQNFIEKESDIPADAMPIDPQRSTWAMGWGMGIYYYRDLSFGCCDCGAAENWTAESQAHYFEVMQSSPYKVPVRCYACRAAELERKQAARRAAGHPEKPVPDKSTEPVHFTNLGPKRKRPLFRVGGWPHPPFP